MSKVLLISEEYFKKNTPVSSNFEVTTPLRSIIQEAQFKFIRPLICPDLYEQILDEVETSSLTTVNETLLENYIKPTLAYYTYYTVLPFSNFKLRDAGLITQNGGNYSNNGIQQIEYIRNIALESAQTYASICLQFIEDNYNDYPLFNCKGCNSNDHNKLDGNVWNNLFLAV